MSNAPISLLDAIDILLRFDVPTLTSVVHLLKNQWHSISIKRNCIKKTRTTIGWFRENQSIQKSSRNRWRWFYSNGKVLSCESSRHSFSSSCFSSSVAIFAYLCNKYHLDRWYPKDSKERARVDEYVNWQHLNIRATGSMVFRAKVIENKWIMSFSWCSFNCRLDHHTSFDK